MRNSLKAVLFGAISVVFSASLQAEAHQHDAMNAASDAASEQIIHGKGVVKAVDLTKKKSPFLTTLFRPLAGPR